MAHGQNQRGPTGQLWRSSALLSSSSGAGAARTAQCPVTSATAITDVSGAYSQGMDLGQWPSGAGQCGPAASPLSALWSREVVVPCSLCWACGVSVTQHQSATEMLPHSPCAPLFYQPPLASLHCSVQRQDVTSSSLQRTEQAARGKPGSSRCPSQLRLR